MGKAVVVAVALMAVLMASDSQAGWVRKTLGKVVDVAKPAIQGAAVKQIAGLVTKYGVGMLGKRSANVPGVMTAQREARAQQLINELELACPRFGINTKAGLTGQVLTSAFRESDGNKDGTLSNQEQDLFENIVDAFQHCLQVLKAQGK